MRSIDYLVFVHPANSPPVELPAAYESYVEAVDELRRQLAAGHRASIARRTVTTEKAIVEGPYEPSQNGAGVACVLCGAVL